MNIAQKISIPLREGLQQTIIQATIETIETFFGCHLKIASEKPVHDMGDIVACVPFRQGIETVLLRLAFDRGFMCALTSTFYDTDIKNDKHREMCEDAASELANIIGNRVKFFMNSHAFTFVIDLPYIEHETTPHKNASIIDLNFKLQEEKSGRIQGIILSVNLDT